MKKFTFTTAMFMAMTTTGALAHHPAADIVDPEIYSMIDANVADTPHAEMVMDDMGSAMETAVGTQNEPRMEMAGALVSNDGVADTADMVDTMVLMESLPGSMAQ